MVVAGFVIGSLYCGEFGVPEPSATIDAIGVHAEVQRRPVTKGMILSFGTT